MDYLTSLKVFCTVVEAKSFARAADILGLSPPVVSRAIAGLEERLGSRLFNRTTRQISLTETAERFFSDYSRLLDELQAMEERPDNRRLRGRSQAHASDDARDNEQDRQYEPAHTDHQNPRKCKKEQPLPWACFGVCAPLVRGTY